MLADGIVEDLSVVSHAIELDLLRVQDELAHDDRLVLSQLASGKQEFLEKKKKKTRTHATNVVSQWCSRLGTTSSTKWVRTYLVVHNNT